MLLLCTSQHLAVFTNLETVENKMSARETAFAFKAWAQENHLIGEEFPVQLDLNVEERDAAFDSLRITAASEYILRQKQITGVAFNNAQNQVIVLTARKVAQKDLKVLPTTFGEENIPVVYVHGGNAQAGGPVQNIPPAPYALTQGGQYACGGSIHPARFVGSGTLGCLVRDANGVLYGLTNNHVSGMCNYAFEGEKILAPGHTDITAAGIDPFTIGYHFASLPMVPGVPDNVNVSVNQDAALVRISNEARVSSMQGSTYDTPANTWDLEANQDVEKVGRTTGHTSGKVLGQMAGAFAVNYQVPNLGAQQAYFDSVFVVASAGAPFSQPGDSGSLVVANLNGEKFAVGLVFAGDSQGLSYLLPLNPILTSFNVNLATGHNP